MHPLQAIYAFRLAQADLRAMKQIGHGCNEWFVPLYRRQRESQVEFALGMEHSETWLASRH